MLAVAPAAHSGEGPVPRSNAKRIRLAALKKRIAKLQKRTGQARQLLTLLRQAAALDDVEALEHLGMLLRDGVADKRGRRILTRNDKASIRCYRRAAELGSSSAMDALATGLMRRYEGGGKRPDRSLPAVSEALRWHRKAVGLGGDCYNLAVAYQNLGQHKKAVAWFRKNAAAGQIDALLALAKAELHGIGTRRNVPAALEKLRHVCEANGASVCQFDQEEAARVVAQVLYDGWLVPRDYRGPSDGCVALPNWEAQPPRGCCKTTVSPAPDDSSSATPVVSSVVCPKKAATVNYHYKPGMDPFHTAKPEPPSAVACRRSSAAHRPEAARCGAALAPSPDWGA